MNRLVIYRTRIRHHRWKMSIKVAFSLRLDMKSRRLSNDMTPLSNKKSSGLRWFQAQLKMNLVGGPPERITQTGDYR